MPVFFTPRQANEMLPEVEKTLRAIIEIKQATENMTETEMSAAMQKMESEVQKLEDLGCVLKDLDQGLLDFPAVRLGKRVWLCWKLGEKTIKFWHGLQDGFAGRQKVKEEEFYGDDLAINSLAGSEVLSKSEA